LVFLAITGSFKYESGERLACATAQALNCSGTIVVC
jgi:hypothetical protein